MHELKNLILILVIFTAACVETDIYLPAFPDMMRFFSTSEGDIQSLLTWNFLGICLSGPFYGPLSDSFGRKKPLMIALALFLLGSLITLVAHTFDQMLAGRVLQGIGSGGCFTLGTAIIFDAFQANRAILAINQINSIAPFIMALAPLTGGVLNQLYGFRSNFIAIAILVLLSFLTCLFFFDESLPKEKRLPLKPRKIWGDFKKAATCWSFWQLTLVVSLLNAGYLAFLSGSAVLFVVSFGLSQTFFPFYQAAILGAWLLASLTLNRALSKWGLVRIKQVGVAFCLGGALLFTALAFLTPQDPTLLTGAMLFFTFGVNWTQGLYFPEGMEILPDIKGMTASLLTSTRLLLTAFIVGLGAFFYDGTIYPLVALITGILLIVIPIIILYERRKLSKEACGTQHVPHNSL